MPDEGSILDGLPITRRRLLTGAVLAGVSISEIVEALDADGESGVLYGGIAALNQAYNPAGNLYVGPDSTKSSVNAKSGRVFLATDTQVDYYGDSGSWVKMGIGSSSTPAGPSYFESLSTEGADINGHTVNPDQVATHPAADRPEAQIGNMPEMRATPDIVGTRQLAGVWPLVGHSDYSATNSWADVRSAISWIVIHQPPNKTPVLAAFVHYDNDSAGESTEVEVNSGGGRVFLFKSPSNSEARHYQETYLVEEPAGLAKRSSYELANWNIQAKATGTSGGTVYADSALLLYWEVV